MKQLFETEVPRMPCTLGEAIAMLRERFVGSPDTASNQIALRAVALSYEQHLMEIGAPIIDVIAFSDEPVQEAPIAADIPSAAPEN